MTTNTRVRKMFHPGDKLKITLPDGRHSEIKFFTRSDLSLHFPADIKLVTLKRKSVIKHNQK